MKNLYEEIIRIENGSAEPAVLVTVVRAQDSSPRAAGSKMLVRHSGDIMGTIGGGAIENIAKETACRMFSGREQNMLQEYDLTSGVINPVSQKTGMLCGGLMTLYYELLRPLDRIIIFGAGHIGSAITPIAQGCGFDVTIIDDRPDFARADRFSNRTTVICAHPVEHAGIMPLFPSDSIVILTHNHRYDSDVLNALLRNESEIPRYIGMIGSRKKVGTVLENIAKSGVQRDALDRVFSPIGLDIGGDNPTEIAVSIMAELQAIRYGRLSEGTVCVMRNATR